VVRVYPGHVVLVGRIGVILGGLLLVAACSRSTLGGEDSGGGDGSGDGGGNTGNPGGSTSSSSSNLERRLVEQHVFLVGRRIVGR
jgi:hypothetical protein